MGRIPSVSAAVIAGLFATAGVAQREAISPSNEPARLQPVASFDHQVTGVTVAQDGRIFVNFPRWTEDAPISAAEVAKDGRISAYPNADWNSWRNTRKDQLSPGDLFVCVQSVVADRRGNLWVVDPAAPGQGYVVPGGAKLVRVDLATNRVAQVIRFDDRVAPRSSYLNDVRLSADGRHAYRRDPRARMRVVGQRAASTKEGDYAQARLRPINRGRHRRATHPRDAVRPVRRIAVERCRRGR